VTTTTTTTAKQQTLSFWIPPPPPPSASVVDLTSDDIKPKSMPSRKRRPPPVTQEAPAMTDATSFFEPKSKVSNTSLFPVFTLPKTHSFTKQDIDSCLQKVFQLQSLRRNLQSEAVQNALRHESQLLILATGGGKSLCYQLPACLLGGVTIVVSPLIALMQDQMAALEHRGIPSAHVSSQQTTTENNHILTRLLDTTDRPLTLLYITPESIQTDKMRTLLQQLHEQQRLTMFAIDEAHCLSRSVL
jgi:DEAD/DEAH box helicase